MRPRKSLATWFKQVGPLQWANRYRFSERVFASHVTAVGQVLLAWNNLHERLSTLFAGAMGAEWVHFAIWHSVRSDYSKRQMLRVAIKNLPEELTKKRPKLIKEVQWILNMADELEGKRDDAAHTPMHFADGLFDSPDILSLDNIYDIPLGVAADDSFRNPRALRIRHGGNDILYEHRWTRDRIVALRDYVIAISHVWMNARAPWPERPDLPNRKPSRRSKGSESRRTRK